MTKPLMTDTTKSKIPMNVASLASLTAEETGLPKPETEATLRVALKIIAEVVASGESVRLEEFGTFCSQVRSIREGRNPKNGESVYIPAPITVAFFAGKAFREAVNK